MIKLGAEALTGLRMLHRGSKKPRLHKGSQQVLEEKTKLAFQTMPTGTAGCLQIPDEGSVIEKRDDGLAFFVLKVI